MTRRRGVKVACVSIALSAALAGVAAGYERFAPLLDSVKSGLSHSAVESPGRAAKGAAGEFDPVVMMAGLAAGGAPIAATGAVKPGSAPRAPTPETGLIIFGPGGNGPAIDASRRMASTQNGSPRPERPPVKESTVVLVRETGSGPVSHR